MALPRPRRHVTVEQQPPAALIGLQQEVQRDGERRAVFGKAE